VIEDLPGSLAGEGAPEDEDPKTDAPSPWLRGFLGFYLLAYAAVALYFFLQAIETLRPRCRTT
jgi:hypothetical protein